MILSSLLFHRRAHIALALGVAVGTAVLTGALLVGDSMRGSLRRITLERLGRIDEALVTEHFFRAQLAEELAADQGFQDHFTDAVPCILLQGAVIRPDTGDGTTTVAGNVTVIGYDQRFWKLDSDQHSAVSNQQSIIPNAPLAQELGVSAGDEIVLQIPLAQQVPGDSPLGEKTDTTRGRRLQVDSIVRASGLGRFSLNPSQQTPLCLFVPMGVLQEMLEQPGRVNAILVADGDADEPSTPSVSAALAEALRPRLDDYGLDYHACGEVIKYSNLTSRRMLLPSTVVKAASERLEKEQYQETFTYLANSITAGDRKIPYSTVTGIDSTAELGPLFDSEGKPILLADDEIVLNDWAAKELAVEVDDEVEIHFYEPESTHGEPVESVPASRFRVKAIVPLAGPDGSPTVAADPHLTPEVKGVTDQESIDDWDLSFELVEKIRPQDEEYWDTYRATPKAFVSLATARRLWSSRFGDTTSVRIPAAVGLDAEQLEEKLALDPAELGFVFRPIKRMGLEASAGTTPFSVLFLGFSFFLIAAAMMLVALLFSLSMEQRASEVGILAATGFAPARMRNLFLCEAGLVSCVGAMIGVGLGIGYAELMIYGLRTWWLAAVTTPFVQLEITAASLVIGFCGGVLASICAVGWSLRRMLRLPAVRLLSGRSEEDSFSRTGRRRAWIGWVLIAGAVAIGVPATSLGGEAQAGAFFGSGSLVLIGALFVIRARWLGGVSTGESKLSFGLARLAQLNATRNPSRSLLTIGVVASASFLVVAISAFQLSPSDAGTGGMELVAQSAAPIFHDLNTDDGRFELGFSDSESDQLDDTEFFSFRVRGGDDASCLNLYQPTAPRTLGVSSSWVQYFSGKDAAQFAWAESAAETDEEKANPWRLLEGELEAGAVPVVLDKNTAMYSLHLFSIRGTGTTFEIDHGNGQRVRYQIVGLLAGSIFQGELLISESNFKRLFPEVNGYRFFLAAGEGDGAKFSEGLKGTGPSFRGSGDEGQRSLAENWTSPRLTQLLETRLSDYGFDATRADDRLESFLSVQNTYLATFQSLGALGLLLGTFGLAVVEIRSVIQRRGELALLRACGFQQTRLASLVLLENATLLLLGLAVGILSATVAVLPHFWLGGAGVPWMSLTGLLGAVVLVGLAAGVLPMRTLLRLPLIPALRGE